MSFFRIVRTNKFAFVVIVAIWAVPIITALMFNLAEIGPHNYNTDIVLDGDETYISTDGIQLAGPASLPEAGKGQSRSGRAIYAKPLHLWDAGSGRLADFGTIFSFVIDSESDGLSFFLAGNSSYISAGGAMGLPVVMNASSNLMAPVPSSPFVAVEFDTNWNANWDPVDGSDVSIGNHVGINVNSLVSVKTAKWGSNITYRKEYVVKIRYDSASRNLTVTIGPNQVELHYTVDLRSVLPEFVTIGFSSSSSGDHFQRSSVKSWCFNSSDLYVNQNAWRENKDKKRRLVVVIVPSLLISLTLGLCFLVFFMKNKNDREKDEITKDLESMVPRQFTFEELSRATNNFAEERKLGAGGFGAVYRGVLSGDKDVAVKRVSNTSQQGIKEYKAEVTIVSRAHHKHLVQLIGWCHEIQGQLLVVYELMENRSLDLHLFDPQMRLLPWDLRYKIALGLAKAVDYLHEGPDQCVLHRDIKSANVMLDSKFEAKLSDFGLAKLVDHDISFQISNLAGTKGYFAPEYAYTGRVSPQSDIYSFGVVVLEIAAGRRSLDSSAQEDQKSLVKWVRELYRKDKILEAVDPRLGDHYDELEMKGLMVLGLWCAHDDPHERPSMKEVVNALNNTEDPLSDLRGRIRARFFSDPPTPQDLLFASTFQSFGSSASVVPVEIQTLSPPSDNAILPQHGAEVHLPRFTWPDILFIHHLMDRLGIT